MANALAHFSIGATIVILVLLITRTHTSPWVPLYVLLGGIWAMGPDIHHVLPHDGLADLVYAFHQTPWADLFGFHYTMDVYLDPGNTNEFMGLCFAIYCVATTVLALARYRTEETSSQS